jgi:predicted alpha/beta superfamily hydrolase
MKLFISCNRCFPSCADTPRMTQRRHLLLSLSALLPPLVQVAQARPRSVGDRLTVTDPLPMPGLNRSRRLRIYLPPSYASHPSKRYPVIYFHDGQNVFDNATSYAGEWGADELLDDLALKHGFEAIAVGIDNGEQRRMQELNPWDHERFGKGEGFAYLRFLVETVKPYIDSTYRSRTEAALHRHRDVFGLGGVLSPAYWTARPAVYLLVESEPLLASQRVFIYAGGREDREMVPLARRMLDLVRAQTPHAQFVEEPEAGHNEAAWRAVLPRALAFLFSDALQGG